jgi:serine/threonine-protein kinase
VRYPVHIRRGEHWDGAPPDGVPAPVRLPRAVDLGADDCFVPAGWFQSGGDPGASVSLPGRRLWCDDLVVRRFPVTNTEYIAFLDDLVASGHERRALRLAPRERSGTAGELGALIYAYSAGRFHLRPDADGDTWRPSWPVVMVDWHGARAYADWLAAREGVPWRLPGELEWEKAARGVDGRFFPWGNHIDPTWCRVLGSQAGRAQPAEVDSYPLDESPYGVRGVAGNTRDWCGESASRGGPAVRDGRVTPPVVGDNPTGNYGVRGGSWSRTPSAVRLADRGGGALDGRYAARGFRLVRSIEPAGAGSSRRAGPRGPV